VENKQKQASHMNYTDGELLDLIEDFLVNHFGQDERSRIAKGPAFDMLEHVSELVDLRAKSGAIRSSQMNRIRLALISIDAALEFGSLKHAAGAVRQLSSELGLGTDSGSCGALRLLFERRYIAKGFLYAGCLHAHEIADHEQELEKLLADGIVVERNSGIESYELSPKERQRLIQAFDLAARWQEQAPEFQPNTEGGEISDVQCAVGASNLAAV
jgi:hypothetical protein